MFIILFIIRCSSFCSSSDVHHFVHHQMFIILFIIRCSSFCSSSDVHHFVHHQMFIILFIIRCSSFCSSSDVYHFVHHQMFIIRSSSSEKCTDHNTPMVHRGSSFCSLNVFFFSMAYAGVRAPSSHYRVLPDVRWFMLARNVYVYDTSSRFPRISGVIFANLANINQL